MTAASARAQASARLRTARENCPHWDYESDGEGHDCCNEVQQAQHEYRRIRRKP